MLDIVAAPLGQLIRSANQLTALAIVCAGILLMFRQFSWCARLFALALLFTVVGRFGAQWLPG